MAGGEAGGRGDADAAAAGEWQAPGGDAGAHGGLRPHRDGAPLPCALPSCRLHLDGLHSPDAQELAESRRLSALLKRMKTPADRLLSPTARETSFVFGDAEFDSVLGALALKLAHD